MPGKKKPEKNFVIISQLNFFWSFLKMKNAHGVFEMDNF